jgi:hypothetical protein
VIYDSFIVILEVCRIFKHFIKIVNFLVFLRGRLNALPKHIENRENSQLLNFNNFTYYNKINIIFYNKDKKN